MIQRLIGAIGLSIVAGHAFAADPLEIGIGYLRHAGVKQTLSLAEQPAENDGVAGALLAIEDNNTTGKFLNQRFTLTEVRLKAGDDADVLYGDAMEALRRIQVGGAHAARLLKPGALVVLESTTYPGTTDEIVRPMLEKASGLAVGIDFHLAFSPERIDPGNERYGMRNTPKVVGGITPACTEAAAAFYGQVCDTVVKAKSAREAEMAKLLENTYRHVNIALVNEMSIFCHELGIDLWDAIRCAATKPFGFQAFYPGPGVGGHCIPIDPNYLSYKVRAELKHPFRFVELAQEINSRMPGYVVDRAAELLNTDAKALNGAKVLLLGVTYKNDIADQRESPARPIARKLLQRGALLSYHDPFVDSWQVDGTDVRRAESPAEQADLTILLQAHAQYDLDSIAASAHLLFDTRGKISGDTVYPL